MSESDLRVVSPESKPYSNGGNGSNGGGGIENRLTRLEIHMEYFAKR